MSVPDAAAERRTTPVELFWDLGLRLVGSLSRAKPLAAAGCLVAYAVAGELPAWTTAGMVAAVLAVLVVYESVSTRAVAATAGSSAPS
jgi:hypothetical protein